MLTQAEINVRMRPWGDAEYRRFDFRVGLLQRRGLQRDDAEAFADRLALRDMERDDRRSCLECAHLQKPGSCFAAQQGWLPQTSKWHEPATGTALFRCEQFDFVRP